MTENEARELMDLIASFPHCEKGLCMTPATRIASYYADEKKVAEYPSCDFHGIDPIVALPGADLLRAGSDLLRAANFAGWWESYSGPLEPAHIALEFSLVVVNLLRLRGSSMKLADTWELYAKVLEAKREELVKDNANPIAGGYVLEGPPRFAAEVLELAVTAAREVAATLRAK